MMTILVVTFKHFDFEAKPSSMPDLKAACKVFFKYKMF